MKLRIVPIAALVLVSGCAEFKQTRFDVSQGKSLTLPAESRVIFVAPDGKGSHYVCAEPSPDAIQSIATELAAAADTGQGVKGELSLATRDAVASIAQRTPTIQAMRDLLYRACEARINGLIGESYQVELILRQLDNVLIAMHAIDGVTGMHQPPVVAIGQVTTANTSGDDTSAGASEVRLVVDDLPARTTADASAVAEHVVRLVALTINEDKSLPVVFSDQFDAGEATHIENVNEFEARLIKETHLGKENRPSGS